MPLDTLLPPQPQPAEPQSIEDLLVSMGGAPPSSLYGDEPPAEIRDLLMSLGGADPATLAAPVPEQPPQPPAVSDQYVDLKDVPKEAKLGQAIANWKAIYSQFGGSGANPSDILYWAQRMPIVGGVMQAVDTGAAVVAQKKIADGTATDDDFNRFGQYVVDQEMKGQRTGFGQRVMDVATAIPGFGMEFAMGGSVVKGAVAGAGKMLGKEAAKAGAAGLLKRGAKATAFEAARAAAMPQRIAESASRRMMDDFKLSEDEAGRVSMEIKGHGDGLGKAIGMGALDTFIETLTERSGGALVGLPAKGARKALEKTIGKTEYGQALSDFLMRKWIAAKPGRTPQAFSEYLKEFGYNGVVGELAEERAGDTLRGMTGVEKDYGTTGKVVGGAIGAVKGEEGAASRLQEGLRDLMIEAAAFAVPGAPGMAASAIDAARFAVAKPGPKTEAAPEPVAPATGASGQPAEPGIPKDVAPGTPPAEPQPEPAFTPVRPPTTPSEGPEAENPATAHKDTGEVPAEPSESSATTFTTELGSTYTVTGRSTTRTKSKHPGHDPADVGQKEPSAFTVYVNPEIAREIGAFNTIGPSEADPTVSVEGSEIVLRSKFGKGWTQASEKRFPFEEHPRVGLSPVEFWDNGKNHPGNVITAIQGPTQLPPTSPNQTDEQPTTAPEAPGPEEIGNWTRRKIEDALPGWKVSGRPQADGWRATRQDGKFLDFRVVDEIPVTPERAAKYEKDYGKGASEKLRLMGSFRLGTDDFNVNGLGLVKLRKDAQDQHLTHELVHAAHRLGFIEAPRYEALKKEFYDPGDTRTVEEQIADKLGNAKIGSRAKMEGNRLMIAVKNGIDKLLQKFGIDAKDVSERIIEDWTAGKLFAPESTQAVRPAQQNQQPTAGQFVGKPPAAAEKQGETATPTTDKLPNQFVGQGKTETPDEARKRKLAEAMERLMAEEGVTPPEGEKAPEAPPPAPKVKKRPRTKDAVQEQSNPAPQPVAGPVAADDIDDRTRNPDGGMPTLAGDIHDASTRGWDFDTYARNRQKFIKKYGPEKAKAIWDRFAAKTSPRPDAAPAPEAPEKPRPTNVSPPGPAQTPAKTEQAKANLDASVARLKKALEGKVLSGPPIDRDVLKAFADVTVDAAKYGIRRFEDFVKFVAEQIGEKAVLQFEKLVRLAWRAANVDDAEVRGTLDEPGDVHAVLKTQSAGGTDRGGVDAGTDRGEGEAGRGGDDGLGAESGDGSEPAAVPGSVSEDPEAAGRPANGEGEASRDDLPGRDVTLDADSIGGGGPKAKYRDNVAAIKTLKAIQKEGRTYATPAEQAVLSKYVGWGMFPGVFNDLQSDAFKALPRELRDEQDPNRWKAERDEIKDLLTQEEWDAAFRSTINAHYTSPQIVTGMWQMMQRLGFGGGRTIETSAGIGNFIGLQPENAKAASQWTAVELDQLTGDMLKLLYPSANTFQQGYQNFTAPDDYFDLAISNVPFSNEIKILSDRRYSKLRPNLHDYFFLKSIDKIRPGGLLAFITSTGTMDKPRSELRQILRETADLVAAFRLPENTFGKNAGTAVVTDLIILQKREPGQKAGGQQWLSTGTVPDPAGGKDIPINEYYVAHPEHVLGIVDRKSRMYGKGNPHVSRTDDFEERWARAIASLPEGVYKPLTHEQQPAPHETLLPEDAKERPGQLVVKDGKLYRAEQGRLVEIPAPVADGLKKSVATRRTNDHNRRIVIVRAVAPVREAVLGRIDSMLEGADDMKLLQSQQDLKDAYDAFVRKHGPLNAKKAKDALDEDVDYPLLASLEIWDGELKKVTGLADIFTKNTLAKRNRATHATTPAEALALVLDEGGRVDVAKIAKLLGRPEKEVAGELRDGGLAYHDPGHGWVRAESYLSGNVLQKLQAARIAAETDPDFAPNVKALEKVQPEKIPYTAIYVRPGGHWIAESDFVDFFIQMLGGRAEHFRAHREPTSNTLHVNYTPRGRQRHIHGELATQVWGTPDVDFMELFQHAIDSTRPVVKRTDADGTRYTDQDATAAAQRKLEEIIAYFEEWLWTDDARRERLEKSYNEKMNVYVLPKYDGGHLTFPGMVEPGTILPSTGKAFHGLRPNQRRAVWRFITRGTGLAAHEVGTGKTMTYVATAMELRRLGLAHKPALFVPDSRAEATYREARDLYPGAKILSASRGMNSDERRATVAKIASGDWDLVILTHPNMKKIPLSDDMQLEYLKEHEREIREILIAQNLNPDDKDALSAAGRENGAVKHLANLLQKVEEKIHAIAHAGGRDTGVSFEETGIDFLIVDEAHEFKSLPLRTNMGDVKGIPTGSGSEAAQNLDLIATYVQRRNNGRGLVLGTGTPVTNTMAELYIMQQYVQKNTLREAGLLSFDAWANSFGEALTRMELTHSGQPKVVTRFIKFINLPELRHLAFQDIDYFRADDDPVVSSMLNRPKKTVREVVVEGSAAQRRYLEWIGRRAQSVGRPERGGDNHLLIASDGTKSALDMRLVADVEEDANNKAKSLVAEILKMLEEDPEGTHFVFVEKGRSTNPAFDLVADITEKLVGSGIPREKIADFRGKDGEQKAKLAEKLRTGKIQIALGNTKTLGTGVNAQDNAAAVHHLEPSWTPEAWEQRNGRVWRQGNRHGEVQIISYLASWTLDSWRYQVVGRKDAFIHEFFGDTMHERSMDDEDTDEVPSDFTRMQILASGNPLAFEEMNLQNELASLETGRDANQRQKLRTRDQIQKLRTQRDDHETAAKVYESDAAHYATERTKQFEYAAQDGTKYTDRKEAAKALAREWLTSQAPLASGRPLGEYRGFKIVAVQEPTTGTPVTEFYAARGAKVHFSYEALTSDEPQNVWLSLDSNLRNLDAWARQRREMMQENVDTIKRLFEDLERPWRDQKKYSRKTARLANVRAALNDGLAQLPKGADYLKEQSERGVADWEHEGLPAPAERFLDETNIGFVHTRQRAVPTEEKQIEDVSWYEEQFSAEEDPNDILDLMRQIEPGADKGTLVSMADLRQKAGLSKAEFERTVLSLARAEVLSLQRHDYVAPLSDEEVGQMIFLPDAKVGGTGEHPRGLYYHAVAIRQRSRASEESFAAASPNQGPGLWQKLGAKLKTLQSKDVEVPKSARAGDDAIEQALQLSRGLPEENWKERIERFSRDVWHAFSRANIHLPENRFYSPFLRLFRDLRGLAALNLARVSAELTKVLEPLQDNEKYTAAQQMYFVERLLIAKDMLHAFEKLGQLKYGFKDGDEIQEYVDRLQKEIDSDQQLAGAKEALKRREALRRRIVQELVNAKMLNEEALANDAYFHRDVLEKAFQRYGQANPQWLQNRKRSFEKARTEGLEGFEHNTNYLQSESIWLVDALDRLETQRLRKEVLEKRDRYRDFNWKAKQANYLAIVGGQKNFDRILEIRSEMESIRAQADGPLDSDDRKALKSLSEELWDLDPTMPFRQKMATATTLLEKHGFSASEDFLEEVQALAKLRTTVEGDRDPESRTALDNQIIAARMFLKAISDKENFLKERLGDKYQTWEKLLREHNRQHKDDPDKQLAEWFVKPGNLFYKAYALPDRLVEKIDKGTLDASEITKESLNAVLALGRQIPMLLPKKVVDQLEAPSVTLQLGLPALETAVKAMLKTTSWTKQYLLHAPHRVLKYNLGNILTDLGIMAQHSGMAAYLPKARQDLRKSDVDRLEFHTKAAEAAFNHMVIGSGQSADAREGADIEDLPAFQRFKMKAPTWRGKAQRLVGKYFRGAGNLSQSREDITRYAAFLYFRDKLQKGDLKFFGGSNKQVVLGLLKEFGVEHTAAWLARTEFGDYGNTSAIAPYMAMVMPFYRWMDTVMHRVPRSFLNALEAGDMKSAGIAAWQMTAQLAKPLVLAQLGRLILPQVLEWLWNNLVRGDDEDKLSEADKQRPHLNLGKWFDGSVMTIRNTTLLGDFLSYFGLPEATQLLAKWATDDQGRVRLSEAPQAMLKAMVNKAWQSATPLAKTPLEAITGHATFPDVFNPRIANRDELVAQALGVRDLWMDLKGLVFQSGERGHSLSRRLAGLVVHINDNRDAALSDFYDQVNEFKKSKGEPTETSFPVSQYRAMRHAARNDDFESFQKARTKWLQNEKHDYDGYRRFLSSLDPWKQVPERYREEFLNQWLNTRQRERVDLARGFGQELQVKMWLWWQKAAEHDEAGLGARLRPQMDTEIATKAMQLVPPTFVPPTAADRRKAQEEGVPLGDILKRRRQENDAEADEAKAWFSQRASELGRDEVLQAAEQARKRGRMSAAALFRLKRHLQRDTVPAGRTF